MAPRSADRDRLVRAGLYAGGFLGPFGGSITTSMLPELAHDYDVTVNATSATITAYFIPFATLMLFSGTLGARWGTRRCVLGAYVVSFVGSVLCAVAPVFPVLLVGRGVQGMANAFTTPLLLATIAATTPRARLSRALGLFASLQSAGQTSGPLVGGLAAEATWRLAFVGVGVAAAVLAFVGLPDTPERGQAEVVRLRSAWRPEVLRAAAVALVGWGCLGGLTFLVAFRAEDAFGLSSGQRGLLLTAFGVVGMLTAALAGHAVDRIGGRRGAMLGTVASAVPVLLVGVLPWLPAVALMWALCGFCAQFVQVGLNTLVLTSQDNPAGAVSVVQAFRFIGTSAAPIAFTAPYHASPVLGFGIPAVLLAVAAPIALLRAGRARVGP
ncbi:MFS transporter [Actinophytocola oryzae]|uniref:Putative MFS family arabinose efflux permease n=1 Tax=Actinophytocola oryzae TaxID=502181 RepID=A0A4R7V656_9PSEU|nr:MFS transporter [Actinophytocola oryzae]TDV44919.1 putative MFS family arabinose efflux permease [Actinophytocola oryzae]